MADPASERASSPNTNLMKTSIAALAALAIVGGAGFAFASTAPRTYPGDNFTLRVDNSGAIHRVPFIVERVDTTHTEIAPSPVAPIESENDTALAPPDAAPPAAVNPQPRADDCTLPAKAISTTDKIENFAPANGRFSKVPQYLVRFYEEACRDFKIPVRYLVADGSYESHFRSGAMGDSGTSCGIHMFRDTKRTWRGWFPNGGLVACHDAEQNIRKAAEHWRTMMDRGTAKTLADAIRRHNGAGPRAIRYQQTVMGGANRYYAL
jgi:hypothetical protein